LTCSCAEMQVRFGCAPDLQNPLTLGIVGQGIVKMAAEGVAPAIAGATKLARVPVVGQDASGR